jgi:hypothetical protein
MNSWRLELRWITREELKVSRLIEEALALHLHKL